MARRRKHRGPITRRQRFIMVSMGIALILFACGTILYETLAWEGGNPLALGFVLVTLFFVFIAPIIAVSKQARRRRVEAVGYVGTLQG